MDRSILKLPSKLLSFYVVCSMESSNYLWKKHGITKMGLHLQMCTLNLLNDYDVITSTVRLRTCAVLEREFIKGTNLVMMQTDVRALQI